MSTIQYSVSGLTCGGCVAKVTSILSDHAEKVEVTLDPPVATLNNATSNLNVLNAALGERYALSSLPTVSESAPTTSQKEIGAHEDNDSQSWLTTYYPLVLIIGFIVLVCTLIQFSQPAAFDGHTWMRHFMAGFFFVFAFFKLLDIKSFANSYAMYDLLAMRVNGYGFMYPFIELSLGIAYLMNWAPASTNTITFVVMLFSSLGVIRSVMNKQKIRCACLGSVFNLPMSTVTIVEDLSMAGMALIMLLK